jgi:hypothetical protein
MGDRDENVPLMDRTNKKAGPRSGFQGATKVAYFFAQEGAADLIGAGFSASFFSHFTSMGLMAGCVAGFWQVPTGGFGATTGGFTFVVVVVVVVVVVPPVTTAAERVAEAKTTAAKARTDFILIRLL